MGGKRRKELSIFLGIIGAVLGYAVVFLLFELFAGRSTDPITTGLLVVTVFCPAGAIGGLLLGVTIGRSLRGEAGAESFKASSLKALAIVIGAIVVIGGGYVLYAVSTATPWLRPGGVALQFEVRLPAGAARPDERGVKAELQTSINTMPAEMAPNLFRQDGDRPVIVGQVDLAYRTNSRQIEVKIPGRMDRTYQIKITDKAPHTDALGAWQPHPDGSEIRYRAKWPGRD
jgi:hypothetical protein